VSRAGLIADDILARGLPHLEREAAALAAAKEATDAAAEVALRSLTELWIAEENARIAEEKAKKEAKPKQKKKKKAVANQTTSRPTKLLSELEVGEVIIGRVQRVANRTLAGIMVNVNADRNAFWPFEEFTEGIGFPRVLPQGTQLSFKVLRKRMLQSGNYTVYLTTRQENLTRPQGYYEILNQNTYLEVGKTSVSEFVGLSDDTWVDAELLRISAAVNYTQTERAGMLRRAGILVKVTAPEGDTSITEFVPLKRLQRSFQNTVPIHGSKIKMRIAAVNTTSNRLVLTMLEPKARYKGQKEETAEVASAPSTPAAPPAPEADSGDAVADEEWAGAMVGNVQSEEKPAAPVAAEDKEESSDGTGWDGAGAVEVGSVTTTAAPPKEDASLMEVLFR